MNIDYSLPSATTNSILLAAKAPFIYGKRHLSMFGMNLLLQNQLGISFLDLGQSVKHFCLGVLEMIPGIGHAIALADSCINDRKIRVIHLQSTDPYEMGKEQGVLLKKEIQTLVTKLLMIFRAGMQSQGKNPLKEALKLTEHFPADYRQELEGLAAGAEVPFEDMLVANTIMDTMSLFGCSVYAVSQDTGNIGNRSTSRLCATNYFPSLGQKPGVPDVDESFRRYNDLEAHATETSVESMKEALLKVNYYDTIQSIVFDQGDIHLALAGEYSANTPYTHIKRDQLFKTPATQTAAKIIKLARNMDWPLPLLGRETIVLVRPAHGDKKATAIVGWPGMLGAFSGVNEDGAALAITVIPSDRQSGIPGHMLFRQILEEASTVEEARKVVNRSNPASAWNLVVAAVDGLVRFELDPARQKTGSAQTVSA